MTGGISSQNRCLDPHRAKSLHLRTESDRQVIRGEPRKECVIMKVLILHGPNLNLLGDRERELYGTTTLDELNRALEAWGDRHGVSVRTEQTNSEARLIDCLHDAAGWADGVVMNPAGLAHTSVCLADAVRAIAVPVVEVHLTNVFAREDFRRRSLVAEACLGVVAGLGPYGYIAACSSLLEQKERNERAG
jgi:3-dehydroquinate dehydratase-2